MNTVTVGILGLIVMAVFAVVSMGYLICFIQVLIALFKKEGVGLGILGIIFGIYAYIWGWIKSAELGLRKIMIWWTVCLIALVGMGFVVAAGMIGIVGNPMFKKALERTIRAQQGAYDELSMMQSKNNVKQLCTACISWAEDHQGGFPAQLDDLFVDKYLGTDKSRLLFCPLLNNRSRPNYLYQGNHITPASPGSTTVIVSAWADEHGRHIVGHKDGSVALEVLKQRQINKKAGAESAPAMHGKKEAAHTPSVSSSPAPAMPLPTPSASLPPEAPTITLSADERQERLIHRVIFPSEQMPANTDNYFWVIEFPDHETKVKQLRPKSAVWMAPPKITGTFKVSIEYRAGDLKRAVSNSVELVVP